MSKIGALGARRLAEKFPQDSYALAFESIFENAVSRSPRREAFSNASLRALDEFVQAVGIAPREAPAQEDRIRK